MQLMRRAVLAGWAGLLAGCGRPQEGAVTGPQPVVATTWEIPEAARTHAGAAAWRLRDTGPKIPPETPLLGKAGATIFATAIGGRPALLNFWARWCAPCLAEKPALAALAARLNEARARIAVFPILVADPGATIAEIEEKNLALGAPGLSPWLDPAQDRIPMDRGVSFTALLDVDPSAAGEAVSLPRSWLVAPDGVVIGSIRSGLAIFPQEETFAFLRAL